MILRNKLIGRRGMMNKTGLDYASVLWDFYLGILDLGAEKFS